MFGSFTEPFICIIETEMIWFSITATKTNEMNQKMKLYHKYRSKTET